MFGTIRKIVRMAYLNRVDPYVGIGQSSQVKISWTIFEGMRENRNWLIGGLQCYDGISLSIVKWVNTYFLGGPYLPLGGGQYLPLIEYPRMSTVPSNLVLSDLPAVFSLDIL